MYLSTLTLNPDHDQARRDLGDAFEMHRTLTQAFASDSSANPRPFLWRIEPGEVAGQAGVVVVQSATPANWRVLEGQPGYAVKIHGNQRVDLEKTIEAGGTYLFRLQANPSITRDGRRIPLYGEAGQREWLALQGQRFGFDILAFTRKERRKIQLRQGNEGNRITVFAVDFEGVMKVKSPPSLHKAMLSGLGYGKSWGLGLLSLSRMG